MLILVALLALAAGLAAGVLFTNHRRGPLMQELQRALAERDAARTERMRSDAAVAEARQRLEQEQQARVAAETRFAHLASSRQQMEETFAVLAQRAIDNANDRIVEMNKVHVVGSMDTKKAEFETLLKPLREMLDNYRGELMKS